MGKLDKGTAKRLNYELSTARDIKALISGNVAMTMTINGVSGDQDVMLTPLVAEHTVEVKLVRTNPDGTTSPFKLFDGVTYTSKIATTEDATEGTSALDTTSLVFSEGKTTLTLTVEESGGGITAGETVTVTPVDITDWKTITAADAIVLTAIADA